MNQGDPVRVYDVFEEWYSEGRITKVSADQIEVDFMDWVQAYSPSELKLRHIFYTEVWVAIQNTGTTLSDFR